MAARASDGLRSLPHQVKFGRGAVSVIEVVEGLKPGDQVVLSDMSPGMRTTG